MEKGEQLGEREDRGRSAGTSCASTPLPCRGAHGSAKSGGIVGVWLTLQGYCSRHFGSCLGNIMILREDSRKEYVGGFKERREASNDVGFEAGVGSNPIMRAYCAASKPQ